MEKYYERRIRLFSSSCNTKQHLLLMQALAKANNIDEGDIEEIAIDFYGVKSQSVNGEFYFIDVELGVCSCPSGAFRAFCKHQAALYRHKKIQLPNMPAVSKASRHQMAILAKGEAAKEINFYRGLGVSNFLFLSNNFSHNLVYKKRFY